MRVLMEMDFDHNILESFVIQVRDTDLEDQSPSCSNSTSSEYVAGCNPCRTERRSQEWPWKYSTPI